MNDNNPTVILSKLVAKQQLVINSMSKLISDLIKITISSLRKCDEQNCNLPGTFTFNDRCMCDTHVTMSVVSKDTLESDWKEISNVEEIRFISDYNKIVTHLDSDVTIH